MKINIKAFALACGLLWGAGLFLLTWWLIALEGFTGEPTFLGRFYIGYKLTALGSVIGFVWAFVDAFVGGAVFAWLYNRLARRRSPPADS